MLTQPTRNSMLVKQEGWFSNQPQDPLRTTEPCTHGSAGCPLTALPSTNNLRATSATGTLWIISDEETEQKLWCVCRCVFLLHSVPSPSSLQWMLLHFFHADAIRGKCINSTVFVLICVLALLSSSTPSDSCLTPLSASHVLPQIGNNCNGNGESRGYTGTKGKGVGGNRVTFSAKLLTAFCSCH